MSLRHFIDGTEPGPAGVEAIARRALALSRGAPALRMSKRLISVFMNASLRTRLSLDAACHGLGIHHQSVTPGANAWALEMRDGAVMMDGDKAEHVADAVRVLGQYGHALAVRAFAGLQNRDEDRADPVISAFVKHAPGPVVNLESARYHPLQGLADAATWFDHLGQVQGQRIALVWAPHPRALPAAVPQQVLLTASLLGARITVAHPEGFDLDPEIVTRAQGLAAAGGGEVQVTTDRRAAIEGTQVIVAKSWSGFSGYGRREDEARQRETLGAWRVDQPDFALASPGAGFMHCLPLRRNVVATDAVVDGPSSWVVQTAGLRMHTAMALLEQLLGGDPWTA
ncbi:MAG: N-acetylornithine carbamoyltransferase [Myxococcota bacterium]